MDGQRSATHRAGFTIVEVAMVVGVLVVISALAFPAFQNARHNAQTVRAASTVQQAGITIGLYQASSRDVYPIGSPSIGANRVGWVDALVNAGQIQSSRDMDPHGFRRMGHSSILLSQCFFDTVESMTPSRTLPEEAPCSPIRSSDVVFPALKGLLVQFWLHYSSQELMEPHPWLPGQSHLPPAWCCTASIAAPIGFADGSVQSMSWRECSRTGFVVLNSLGFPETENGVGAPVISTWHGASARDR